MKKISILVFILVASLALSTLNMVHFLPSVNAALTWNIQTVDGSAPNDEYIISSIALDSGGIPHIAYSGYQGQLKYASWTGSAWTLENLGVGGSGQEFLSLAIDSGNVPHIARSRALRSVLRVCAKRLAEHNCLSLFRKCQE